MNSEIWKPVKGFEGIYEISSFGRLKSYKKSSEGFILSLKNSKGGYLSMVLKSKKKVKSKKIHQLVAEAFLYRENDQMQVNHKDFNKQNNHLDNLEYCTPKENCHHNIKNNRYNYLQMVNRNIQVKSKKVAQINDKGIIIQIYKNSKEAAEKTGICRRNICQVAQNIENGINKRPTAGGYKWKYL